MRAVTLTVGLVLAAACGSSFSASDPLNSDAASDRAMATGGSGARDGATGSSGSNGGNGGSKGGSGGSSGVGAKAGSGGGGGSVGSTSIGGANGAGGGSGTKGTGAVGGAPVTDASPPGDASASCGRFPRSTCLECCKDEHPASVSVYAGAAYGCACADCYTLCSITLCDTGNQNPTAECMICIRQSMASVSCAPLRNTCLNDATCAPLWRCTDQCF